MDRLDAKLDFPPHEGCLARPVAAEVDHVIVHTRHIKADTRLFHHDILVSAVDEADTPGDGWGGTEDGV